MSECLERTLASKPTFGDYVTIEMKCYGVPNEYFIHDVMTHPFTSNSWRNVPIDARDPEEHLHDTSETVISVRTQGVNPRDAHIFAVRLADVLPMSGDKWAWKDSPLRSRIAELEAAQRWIPVSERLPELDQDVFAVVEGEIKVGHFYQQWDGEIYFSSNDDAMMVATHWMPLPELPEVQE